MRKLLVLLFLLVNASAQAQLVLQGTVLSRKDNAEVPFATVCISSLNDSIQHNILTDLKGQFTISDLAIKRYAINISSLGYMPLDTTIAIRYPSVGGTTITKKFYLSEDVKMLGEVVKTASSLVQSIDSKSYLITKNDLHNAITGVDLLRKIPYVSFDKATQTLKSSRGGNIKILVNGVDANQYDILALNADQIKKIVCYDFPPAKYAGYSVVLNFITKDRLPGFNAGLSTTDAFTTGYSNDMLHLKYNHGYNQFSVVANTGYRNYKKFDTSDNYEYAIGDNSYKSQIDGKRKFGYDDNYISVAFNRYVPEKYQLNVLFSPNFQHVHCDENQDDIFTVNQMAQKRTATIYSRTKQFVPSLDIYYNVNLRNNQELTFDAVGSLFNATKKYRKDEEFEGNNVFNDQDSQNNKKYSFIGEGNYTKNFKKGAMLTFGNRLSYNDLRAKIENTFDHTEYKTKMLTNYSYVELKGEWERFTYRLSLGMNYYYNKNHETSYSSWIFQPQILVGRKLSNDVTVRAVFSRNTTIPTLSDLSNNKILLTENIISQGNPNLKNSTSNTVGMMLSCNKPWLTSELLVGLSKERNAFNHYFVQEGGYIYQKNENAKYESSFAVESAFTLMPFPKSNLLTAKISASYAHDKINSELIGVYRHDRFPIDYEVNLNIKKFFASYSGNILSWELNAPYMEKGEKVSTLTLAYYPKENISISASMLWLGRDASYSSKTLDNSIVKNWGGTNIHDNKNMITVGFTYRFKSGKSYVDKGKNIENKDTDSGIN